MLKNLLVLYLLLLTVHLHAVHVVFRMDDPIMLADSVTMRVLHLFNEKQVPLTIAMIPCDSSEVSFEATDSIYFSMLQSSNVEIALHGLNHANINGGGEFGCIDSIETERRIRLGKKILESQLGKDIVTFIPPYNIINRFVPKVMLNNGMYILSSDMYGNSYDNKLQYFPETLDRDLDRKGFVTAAKEAVDNAFDTEVCVLMFHVYDFDDEVTWQYLTDILDYCVAQPNIELHTFRSLYERGERSTYHRYRANQLRSGLQKYVLHKGVLHTTRLCWFVHILNALLYALIPLLLLIGIGKMRSYYRNTIYAIVAFGCVAFFMLAFFNVLGPLKLLGVDILFVLCTLILTHSIYRICIKKINQ